MVYFCHRSFVTLAPLIPAALIHLLTQTFAQIPTFPPNFPLSHSRTPCPVPHFAMSEMEQIGTDMTLATVWKCLGQDYSSASAVSAESRKLAVTAETAAKRCRETLGLESIDRAPGVSFAQMVAACDGLRDFCEGRGKGGDGRDTSPGSDQTGEEAAALRNRLRGHCVMIIGKRHGAIDGVTEDGEIAIRWDYWAGGQSWEEGRGTDSHHSSSPF